MLSQYMLRFSVVLLLAGVLMGIGMGISQNFALVGAHAHLNLVGFVVPFLTGLYYQASPAAAATRLARFQAAAATLGAVAFPAAIAAVGLGGKQFVPFAVVGAMVFLSSVVMLALLVFRHGLPAGRLYGALAEGLKR